mgnify:CR=1 FL=1
MKILTCTQQKEADKYTIVHENILSINLMEKAASLITDEICSRWDKSPDFITFLRHHIAHNDNQRVTTALSFKLR